MWSIVGKRLLKRRMSNDDLLSPIRQMLARYDWIPPDKAWIADLLTNQRYADGTSLGDKWQRDLKLCLSDIAGQPTWGGQKARLVRLCLNASSWMVARDVLIPAYQDSPDLWEDVVGASDAFTNNPKSGWKDILVIEGTLNALSFALLSVVGAACFGLSDADAVKLDYYRQLKAHSLKTRTGFSADFLSLSRASGEHPEELLNIFKRDAYPEWERQNSFFSDLEGAIASGNPIERFADRWRALANEYNEVFLRVVEKYKIYSS